MDYLHGFGSKSAAGMKLYETEERASLRTEGSGKGLVWSGWLLLLAALILTFVETVAGETAVHLIGSAAPYVVTALSLVLLIMGYIRKIKEA